MRRIASHLLQAVIFASLTACASTTPAFARLESAVVDDRYAAAIGGANLRVVRADGVVSPSVSMRLLKGDSIITSRTTRVVINFKAGYEVTLDTSTAIFIENPSIFLRIGQAFIRTLANIRAKADAEKLDVHTPQVNLQDNGTEYLVGVTGQGTDVLVLSGAVQAAPRDGSSPSVTYTALQNGRIDAQRGPLPAQRVTAGQAESRLAWVRRVERITKVTVPSVDAMSESTARSTLDRSGFRVLFVLHRETNDVAPGLVVEQSPAAGQLAAPGTYVTLTLSKAARVAMCTVPNLVGQFEPAAKKLLDDAKLRGQGTRRDRTGTYVVSQSVNAGASVPCTTTVGYVMTVEPVR